MQITLIENFSEPIQTNDAVDGLKRFWRDRLLKELPDLERIDLESILTWLLGENPARLEHLERERLSLARQGMEYRYRILKLRYLGVNPTRAYCQLIERLGSISVLRHKIQTWVAFSRERQRGVADVLQEIIQDMSSHDRYMQNQISWIALCTRNPNLRNSLLLATTEEYCLRPIRNQPLLVYRLINFLHRQGRGGITQVSPTDSVRLSSEETIGDENDSKISLFDRRAMGDYQEGLNREEQQKLRVVVQRKFEGYLLEKVGQLAVIWLRLYLQGRSQEAIAIILNLPVKKVYRLREKVAYHALKGFAYKREPELIAQWLDISLREQNFGLTPKQWHGYWQSLTPIQRLIVSNIQEGKTLKAISQNLNWKTNRVMSEWSKLYLSAQQLRNS